MTEGALDLGGVEVRPLLAGRMRLDGGAMFGVVPRPLWQRACPPDDRNRIDNACRCLLVRCPDGLALIDTGCGDRFDDRSREIFAVDPEVTLPRALARAGAAPGDITHVVLTHLHFDHAAGALVRRGGRLQPLFPGAVHVVQRGEWEDAVEGVSIMRSSYAPEDLEALRGVRWELAEGDGPVLPQISVQVTGGHTRHHQAIRVRGDRRSLLFPGDILPSRHHLSPYWIMAYDMFPHRTLRVKQALARQAHEEGWVIAWDHDPLGPFSRLERDERRGYRAVDPAPQG